MVNVTLVEIEHVGAVISITLAHVMAEQKHQHNNEKKKQNTKTKINANYYNKLNYGVKFISNQMKSNIEIEMCN